MKTIIIFSIIATLIVGAATKETAVQHKLDDVTKAVTDTMDLDQHSGDTTQEHHLYTDRTTDCPMMGSSLDRPKCPPGKYQDKSSGACIDCPHGSYMDVWNNAPQCKPCGECSMAVYQKIAIKACTPTSDVVCTCIYPYMCYGSDCATCKTCPEGEHRSPGDDPKFDCERCPDGSWQWNVSRTDCLPCKECEPNFHAVEPCGGSTPTRCERVCPDGTYWDDTIGACQNYTLCGPGTEPVSVGYPGLHLCLSCKEGYYNDGNLKRCEPRVSCTGGERQVYEAESVSNTVRWHRGACSGSDLQFTCPPVPMPMDERTYEVLLREDPNQVIVVQTCTIKSGCKITKDDSEGKLHALAEGVFKVDKPRHNYGRGTFECRSTRVYPGPTASITWNYPSVRTATEWIARLLPTMVYAHSDFGTVMKLCRELSNQPDVACQNDQMTEITFWAGAAESSDLTGFSHKLPTEDAAVWDAIVHQVHEVVSDQVPTDPAIPTMKERKEPGVGCAETYIRGGKWCCSRCQPGNRLKSRCAEGGRTVDDLCTPCEEDTYSARGDDYGCNPCAQCVGATSHYYDCTRSSNTYCRCNLPNTKCADEHCFRCVDI